MFTEFMIELFYSRARRKNRHIAGYVTVFATPLSDKMAAQKTGNLTAQYIRQAMFFLPAEMKKKRQ